MEILNELKKLSYQRFEDNFYLCLGLIFLVIYQLIIVFVDIFKSIFNLIFKYLKDKKKYKEENLK